MVTPTAWKLDSSTFINAVVVNLPAVLLRVRQPVAFLEYIYRVELVGARAHSETREAAARELKRGAVSIDRLTIADVTRMSQLSAPRSVDAGELATAVFAERAGAGVLCDDHGALKWLKRTFVGIRAWESIEHAILAAAEVGLIAEHELSRIEAELRAKRYHCRFSLHEAYGQRCLERQHRARQQAAGDGET